MMSFTFTWWYDSTWHFKKLLRPTPSSVSENHGCQMVYFQTENPNLGKVWRVLQWKKFEYFIDIWSILCPFGTFCSNLVYVPPFWYIVPRKIWQPCASTRFVCMRLYFVDVVVSFYVSHFAWRLFASTCQITRVARWFLLRPKIPIWVYSGGPLNGKCCYIFWSFVILYDNWVYFMSIW
jgi:hypothetical protein